MSSFIQRLSKRIPAPSRYSNLPSPTEKSDRRHSRFPISIFRRRIRLKSDSSISVPLWIVLLFPCTVIIAICFLFSRHPTTVNGVLLPKGTPPAIRKINEKHDKVFATGCLNPHTEAERPRANATFVILARNKELPGVIESIKSMERHFNRWFHYPYTFLNDEEFNSTFKETIRNYTSSPVEFGKIDKSMWGFPEWADQGWAHEGIARQGDAAIMYGGMESYHHMCRFYSGFFYKHELLQKYEWYWRVEPEIKYFCDITYDPFQKMIAANKTYGFTIAVKELKETVPNIFRYASAYKRTNNLTSKGLWEMFVDRPEEDEDFQEGTDPRYRQYHPDPNAPPKGPEPGVLPEIDPESMEGEVYNMCHFWSNFEIARLSWFRSKEYEDFFQMMDRSGGFWMERWGDAPIHSLAAGALLGTSDIHYFRDIGYRHTTIAHCPANAPQRQLPREPWLEETTLEEKLRREEDEYWARPDPPKENGVGCRCRCDTDVPEVENKQGSCMMEWVHVAGGWSYL